MRVTTGTDNDWLNDIMEFDHVVKINPDHTVTVPVAGVYAPELEMGTDGNGSILAEHEAAYITDAAGQGWDLLSGWTGQYGYHGIGMHSSEYIGGSLAGYILDNPGLYVAILIQTDDGDDPDGWAIAYRKDEE